MPTKAIVFGATGSVGSATAIAAQQSGAKVYLALRNAQKPIPGLSNQQEKEHGFERVEADLLKPDTIRKAVSSTGAKHAFVYLVFASQDGMRSSLEALKSSGIEFVVFLSSASVSRDPGATKPQDFIAFAHARAETNLAEIFGGEGFISVRPTYFATNVLRWKKMIANGNVEVVYPGAKFDYISPKDIGRVCGKLLAGGTRAVEPADRERRCVSISGPQMIDQTEVVVTIGKVLGKDVKLTEIDEEAGIDQFVEMLGAPRPAAQHLVEVMRARANGEGGVEMFDEDAYSHAVQSLTDYLGEQPTRFAGWVEENKPLFEV